jgi:hypothetical protein
MALIAGRIAPGRSSGKVQSQTTTSIRLVRRMRVLVFFTSLPSARARPAGDGDAVGLAWIGGGAGVSPHTREQQVNARKPPIRFCQLGHSVAAGDGLIGFRLIEGAEVAVRQIDRTD